MNVTFLVTINLDDLSDLAGTTSEIEQDISNGGFDVVSVKPWQRPSLGDPTVPTTTTQTTNQPIEPII